MEVCWASESCILAVRDILGSVGVELWHLRVEARLLRVEFGLWASILDLRFDIRHLRVNF